MTTLTSSCILYSKEKTKTAIISAKDYPNNNIVNKPILNVEVTTEQNPGVDDNINFTVKISNIIYTIEVKPHEPILNNKNAGVFINYPITSDNWHTIETPKGETIFAQNSSTNRVVLNKGNPLDESLYVDGDEYIIDMIACANLNKIIGVSVTFIRKNNIAFEADICKTLKIINNCVKVPLIHICGQTMIDGSDISDMKFTILDEVEYYEPKSITCEHKNKCCLPRLNYKELKKTEFIKCGVWIISVVIGEGNTLREKLLYLLKNNIVKDDINTILYKIIKYAMTRYILCRILYGDFNINYLKEKHYKKFIKDLGRSRFCRFIEFFQDCEEENFIGYEKYFI